MPTLSCLPSRFSMKSPRKRFITSVITLSNTMMMMTTTAGPVVATNTFLLQSIQKRASLALLGIRERIYKTGEYGTIDICC